MENLLVYGIYSITRKGLDATNKRFVSSIKSPDMTNRSSEAINKNI